MLFLLVQLGCTVFAAHGYFEGRARVQGDWRCKVVYGAVAPMYKPLSVAGWAALMPILSFVHWLRNRHVAPRIQALGVAAGAQPLACNWLSWLATVVMALVLAVWLACCVPLQPRQLQP